MLRGLVVVRVEDGFTLELGARDGQTLTPFGSRHLASTPNRALVTLFRNSFHTLPAITYKRRYPSRGKPGHTDVCRMDTGLVPFPREFPGLDCMRPDAFHPCHSLLLSRFIR